VSGISGSAADVIVALLGSKASAAMPDASGVSAFGNRFALPQAPQPASASPSGLDPSSQAGFPGAAVAAAGEASRAGAAAREARASAAAESSRRATWADGTGAAAVDGLRSRLVLKYFMIDYEFFTPADEIFRQDP
jgi:hypothetical protein